MAKKKAIGDNIETCSTCNNINWIKKDFAFHNPRKLTQEEKESLLTLDDESKLNLYNNVFGTNIVSTELNIINAITKKLNLLASYE